jgi:DNA-binding transcriptional LysR family regulator
MERWAWGGIIRSSVVTRVRRVALQLTHSLGIDRVVSSSDLIACVPAHLAHALAGRAGVRAVALPFELSAVDISQFWHERFQRDEGHLWLRALVYKLFHGHQLGTDVSVIEE